MGTTLLRGVIFGQGVFFQETTKLGNRRKRDKKK